MPERWTPGSALRFLGAVLVKTVTRVAALQADLTHHAAHHVAWDGVGKAGEPSWTDAALAYSDRLLADPELRPYVFGSLVEAVDAWLDALANTPSNTIPR